MSDQANIHSRSTASEVVAGVDLSGKTAIVTGGASGLGLQTALALASAGASVVIAMRNASQGKSAVAEIVAATGNTDVTARVLDLANLSSVSSFTSQFANKPVHILVNNAGIMATPFTLTERGWETQFATNHLGHFALTTGLLPSLLAAGGARVATLSSTGHKRASVDLDDIHFAIRAYDKWAAYGQSKSANALMALGLHLKYGSQGITSNSINPGGIMTGLQQNLPVEEMQAMGWFKDDGTPLDIFKSTEQGASTSVWAVTSPTLEGRGGMYLEDNAESFPAEPTNRAAGYSPHIVDKELALKLWDASASLISLP
jgi:NAD(P)-dependent dehydrogenase (short-subunit alcohol dehydrogenase family)